MAEFEATVRKVGDSMGVIIPHRIIEQLNAHPGQKVRVVIPTKVDWSGVWGRLPRGRPTEQLIQRTRTGRD